MCGISVRIRGYGNNVIQIWNEDSDLHHNDSVSLPYHSPFPVSQISIPESPLFCFQVIQKVKELVPNLEINEFYQCKFQSIDVTNNSC